MDLPLLACEVRALIPVLIGLTGIVSGIVLAWPWLARYPQIRSALVLVGLVAAGLMLSEAPVFASIPTPEHCAWMNAQQWACWVIEALWCACTWPSSPIPPDGF